MKQLQAIFSITLPINIIIALAINIGFAQAPAVPNWQTMSYTFDSCFDLNFTLNGSETNYMYRMFDAKNNVVVDDTTVAGTGGSISIPIQKQPSLDYQAVYSGRIGIDFDDGMNTGHIVVSDSMAISAAVNTDTGFTISTLINRTLNGINEVIFDSKEHIFLRLTDQNKVQLGIRLVDQSNIWLDTDYTPYSGQWTYITAGVEGRTMKIFINGELVAEQNIGTLIDLYVSEANHQVHLGKFVDAPYRSFQGKMAYFSFWSEGPTNGTSDHILRRDQIRYTGNEQHLEVLYRFNQSTSDTDVHNAAGPSVGPGVLNGLSYGALPDLYLPITNIITTMTWTYFVDVNASGANTGCNWTDAFTDLQSALSAVANHDTIKVASGTYIPASAPECIDCPNDDRYNYFFIDKPIILLGSYDPQTNESDYSNPSILSGEIGTMNSADNCLQVLIILDADTPRIDGFTIAHGHATPPATSHTTISSVPLPRERGAACLYAQSNPHFSNITIQNNNGGSCAIFAASGGTFEQCSFRDNSSSNKAAALEVVRGNLTLTDVNFVRNKTADTALLNGGAVYLRSSVTSSMVNCYFIDNYAAKKGGAIYSAGKLSLHSCHFGQNEARKDGGGIYNDGDMVIHNSEVSISFAKYDGGGIYNDGDMAIYNSEVSLNYSESQGGGIYNKGNLVIHNSEIISNDGGSNGGGIYNSNSGSLSIYNSGVCLNWVLDYYGNGGGIYGNVSLYNSLLWDNVNFDNNLWEVRWPSEHETGTLTTSYSLIKDKDLSATNGIDATVNGFDPLFEYASFRLAPGSPLINTGFNDHVTADSLDFDMDGDNTEYLPYDLDGNPRIQGWKVDIGAYEYDSQDTLFVDHTAVGDSTGRTWTDAAVGNWDVLDFATSRGFEVVHIAEGNYSMQKSTNIYSNFKVRGGFPNGGGTPNAGLYFTSLSYPANTPILINAENHEVFIRGLQLIDPSNDVLEFDVKAGELELREVEVE